MLYPRLPAIGRQRLRAHLPAALALLALALCSGVVSASSRITPVVRALQGAMPAVVDIQGRKSQVNGMGTGVVIDPRGYILTNYHVVDGVRQINVTLNSGRKYIAEVISGDPQTDLAVIRIRTPQALPVINLGTSEDLMTGEPVIAVGNAFGYEHTVTTGIISALHRNVQVNDTLQYLDLIQTDASINPGNSGGPLLNIDGEMIGLNAAVRAGAQGIGFAIPVDKALEVATRMMSIERLDDHWHGMTPLAIDGASGPVSVANLHRSGPAAAAGLKRGDELVRIGSVQIERPLDVERALLGRKEGDRVPVVALRDGKTVSVDLPIAGRSARSTTGQLAATPSRQPTRTAESAEVASNDPTWETLGLKLQPAPAETVRKLGLKFQGGMRVVRVRPGSSAEKEGVLKGDILVMVHRWHTTDQQRVQYVIDRADSLAKLGTVRFQIIRGKNWYEGQLALRANRMVSR